MEIISRIILLDREEIGPGESGLAQIVFESPGVNMAGDRFVVRSYSPIRTIGGGTVLDPATHKLKRFVPDILSELEMLLNGTDPERVEAVINRAGFKGVHIGDLTVRTGIASCQGSFAGGTAPVKRQGRHVR